MGLAICFLPFLPDHYPPVRALSSLRYRIATFALQRTFRFTPLALAFCFFCQDQDPAVSVLVIHTQRPGICHWSAEPTIPDGFAPEDVCVSSGCRLVHLPFVLLFGVALYRGLLIQPCVLSVTNRSVNIIRAANCRYCQKRCAAQSIGRAPGTGEHLAPGLVCRCEFWTT